MRLHHIALGARDVDKVAAFYSRDLGLAEVKRHDYPDGALRSVWLDLGGATLMIEHTRSQRPRVDGVGAGPFLLALRVTEQERAALVAAIGEESKTQFTSYFRDPEGNRVAVSHY